jgi:hypothetical protein
MVVFTFLGFFLIKARCYREKVLCIKQADFMDKNN